MKKGFTLIELLAVILILGIIALIAIPTVNKVIVEARMGAFKSGNEVIIKSIEESCQMDLIKGKNPILSYIFKDGKSNNKIDVKGQLPNDGYIFLDNECLVTDYYLTDKSNTYSNGEDIRKDYMLKASTPEQSLFKNIYSAYYNNIKTVNFIDGLNIPDNAISITDVSLSGGGKIKSWLIENEGFYDLYIGSDKRIYANYNSSYLFADLKNIIEYNFSNFNTSLVENMKYMFFQNESIERLDLSKFDTSNANDISYMFDNCFLLNSLNLTKFNTSNVTTMRNLFDDCNSLTIIDVSNFDTSKVTSMWRMFGGFENTMKLSRIIGLENFDTGNVKEMGNMFANCTSLTTLDLKKWDTSNVTSMASMLYNCTSLTSFNLKKWDTSNVTSMTSMFYNCTSLTTLDLSNLDTSNLTNISYMFDNCFSLKSINFNNWNTSNVINMQNMFDDCYSLTVIDLSSFDTSKVTSMWRMFGGINNSMKITKIIGLENFNVKNVTDMGNMFSNCNLLNSLDLSNWVLNENVNLTDLFINCSNLSNIKVKDANIINKLSPYLPGRSSTISGNITIVGDRTNLDTTILESINWNVI